MGRPAKNPEHPLTRLRKALSTPTQEMTRALFSKKVGIPEATIKAIETGKFKISDKNAAQIASVTGVDPKCLMDSSLPLEDPFGIGLYKGGVKPLALYLGDEYLDIKELFCTSVEVAEEKNKRAVFFFLFQRWLEETSEILGLQKAITNKLLDRYPLQCFAAIPKYFWPKDRKKRKDMDERVTRFEKELTVEIVRRLVPEMRAIDTKTIADELSNFKAFSTDESVPKQLTEIHAAFAYAIAEGDLAAYAIANLDFPKLHWDLRKKMIEEAKESLQKQPKR
jgi:DNA-binding XRE family transcriptional regulator